MSAGKRPGSWKEGVAKGFSRFFSRAPSQEKEEEGERNRKDSGDEQERGDRGLSRLFSTGSSQERRDSSESPHAEEQEKGQSVPRLFFRRISQDNKGDTEQTTRDDQEKNKVFPSLFTRASSQEKEEENDMSQTKGATPESDSQENKSTRLMTDSNENVASVEQIKYEPYLIQNEQNTLRTEEEMDLGLSEDVKVLDSEKQSKENFFHFIGNLFHLSPKSSQTNPKAAARNQELRKDNEDAFVKFNVHEEPLHVEQSLDNCNGVSHATEDNEAHAEQTFESSSPVIPSSSTKTSFGIAEIPSVLIEAESNNETPSGNVETPSSNNDSLEGTEQIHDESPTKLPKNTSSSCLEAPAITYGTYRGSRRIRKLLKRRPDINSPIPENEENSERETPDIGNNTDCTAPNRRDGLKQVTVSPKNGDSETSSQTIHVAIHTNESSNNIRDLQPDTENSQLERLQPNSKRIPRITDDLESQKGVLTVTDNLTVNVKDFPNCTEHEQTTLEGRDSILPDEDTVLPEEMMAPETDYEMSIKDMEEPRPGATEPVKSAMDFLPHTKAALDFQSYIEENERNVEAYRRNEGDLQCFEDQHLHSKESVKTSNVSWQPMEKESPMSGDELRPNICPPDVELSTENIGDFQIPDVGLKYAEKELEEEELDKISLIRGDSEIASGDSATTNEMQPNVNMISHKTKDLQSYTKESLNTSEVQHQHTHETSMTTEGFQNSIEENSTYLDYSHPVLESNLFTSKSASARSNENENGNFVQAQEQQMQPDSDIEYDESEFTPNTETHNDDQSGLYSSSLVNSTPEDLQSHKIQTIPSAFLADTKRLVNEIPDAHYAPIAPIPPSNFTDVICSSPITTDLPSDVNRIANYNSIDFCSSSTIIDSNSPVKQTTPALSFDNSVDFPSSAHTTSSQSPLSPADCISLRADSPLPSSEGIDSGVVSSQAYTPEENTIVNISPSELYDNVAFTNSQEHSITHFIEPDKDIPENSVPTLTHFGGTNKLPILPTLSEENVSGMKEGAPASNIPSTNNDVTSTQKCLDNDVTMDKDISSFYREHNHSSNRKPGDFYVAKVCVKSVDVEEVKITPYIIKTEVIAMSKVVGARFKPEFVSLPNISSPPPDKDSKNLKNNNFPTHMEPEKDSVTDIKVSQTQPRDSSDSLQDFQQDDDVNVRCETNLNHTADDEEMSLSSEVRREPAVKLPYPKSKDPYISTASEIVNKCIDSVKQHEIPDVQPNDPNLSDGINSYSALNDVNVAFLNGKNDETPDRPNVVNHIGLLELHNANYIPSGEINANEYLPDGTPQKSTITNQTNDLEFTSSNVNFDQGHVNDETVSRSLHKNVSKVSEGIKETKTHLQPAYNSQGTDEDGRDLTPDVQNDFSPQVTSQDIEQMADSGSGFIENQRLSPSETSPECNDDSSFSVQNGYYVEIGENDEETVDGENNVSEEDLDIDSQISKQVRRVPFYPFSLSPIYEDDSSSEDVLSNRASPRRFEGDDENTNTNDHTSILSLLQSVSDRLKQENNSSLHNEKTELNQSTNETENTSSKSFKGAATFNDEHGNSTDSTECSEISSRHGLFITKSLIDNRPALGLGRKSFLLQVNSQVNTHGPKSSSEPTPLPDSEYKSHGGEVKDPTLTETELSNSTPLKPPSISPLPDVTAQTSDFEPKSHLSPRSVYYQYFSDVNDYSERTDNENSHSQGKMDNSQEYGPQKADSLTRSLSNSDSIKPNPRPGKVVISDIIEHEMMLELYSDILDATSLIFPNGVNIRVIRGCWILYEKADFQGQAHVLEEGEAVLQQLWGPPGIKSTPEQVIIGSIKRVTKDYVPEVVLTRLYGTSGAPICLRTEIPSLKNHLDSIPRSLEVISGVWLAYTDSQFSGTVSVLEEGSVLSSVLESGIQSLRPLKLIILYQKPCFEGWSRELTDHVYSINTMISKGDGIGSIRVIGGIWVGYEKERYKGMQYLLEEGEYEDWNAWGGISDTLRSLRYLHADFLETSVTLFESEAEDGKSIDLFNRAVPDLESSGYSRETQCIHVKKGIWVAYQQKYYCGEQYILEKGRYKSCVDWGGKTSTIMSIRPVMLEPLGKEEPKHLMTAFSDENFQGQCENYIKETFEFPDFTPRSFKVLRGCWLLCYQADTCENLCVVEEGNFPDLVTCGCPAAVIKYIKPIDYVFAEPSISLFALDLCEGRELHFEEPVTSVLSKDLNFYTQSVWVRKGLWIVFEGANFLGRQLLLDAGQILNWTEYSGWKAIGSLRPLKQTPVYFRIKNRHNDKYLTVTGTLTDTRATFVCVSARNGQKSQIWYFCRGLLKSKANDSCLDVIGGKNLPGSKVSLWAEHGKSRQKWRINKDGTITSYISDDLVLDLKGGNYYDQNYIVVNRTQQDVVTQKWNIEIL